MCPELSMLSNGWASHDGSVVLTAGDWVLLGSVVLISLFVWTRLRTGPGRRIDKKADDSQEAEEATRLDYFPMNWSAAEADSSGWGDLRSTPTRLYLDRPRLSASVHCDPTCQERICLSTLAFWRVVKPGVRRRLNDRPLAPTPSELFETVEALLALIVARKLTPTLVLLEPGHHFEFWQQWLAENMPRLPAHQHEHKTAFEWRLVEVLPFLDRRPYGEELVSRLAAQLQSDQGSMSYAHPHYCGHGLKAEGSSISLQVYEDGLDRTVLATWADAQSFIAEAANWSDYGCSGADPDAPLFKAPGDFYLANQRITRARIEEFLDAPA